MLCAPDDAPYTLCTAPANMAHASHCGLQVEVPKTVHIVAYAVRSSLLQNLVFSLKFYVSH